jgi:hypothetical protein
MSTRPVAVKLRIEPDTTVWSPEPSRLELVDPLPEGVRRVDGPERATTDAASLREVLRPRRTGELIRVRPHGRARSGSPIPRATAPTSIATRSGRSSPSTGCDRSARWRSTTCGRRFASAPTAKARRRSPAAGSVVSISASLDRRVGREPERDRATGRTDPRTRRPACESWCSSRRPRRPKPA